MSYLSLSWGLLEVLRSITALKILHDPPSGPAYPSLHVCVLLPESRVRPGDAFYILNCQKERGIPPKGRTGALGPNMTVPPHGSPGPSHPATQASFGPVMSGDLMTDPESCSRTVMSGDHGEPPGPSAQPRGSQDPEGLRSLRMLLLGPGYRLMADQPSSSGPRSSRTLGGAQISQATKRAPVERTRPPQGPQPLPPPSASEAAGVPFALASNGQLHSLGPRPQSTSPGTLARSEE